MCLFRTLWQHQPPKSLVLVLAVLYETISGCFGHVSALSYAPTDSRHTPRCIGNILQLATLASSYFHFKYLSGWLDANPGRGPELAGPNEVHPGRVPGVYAFRPVRKHDACVEIVQLFIARLHQVLPAPGDDGARRGLLRVWTPNALHGEISSPWGEHGICLLVFVGTCYTILPCTYVSSSHPLHGMENGISSKRHFLSVRLARFSPPTKAQAFTCLTQTRNVVPGIDHRRGILEIFQAGLTRTRSASVPTSDTCVVRR